MQSPESLATMKGEREEREEKGRKKHRMGMANGIKERGTDGRKRSERKKEGKGKIHCVSIIFGTNIPERI